MTKIEQSALHPIHAVLAVPSESLHLGRFVVWVGCLGENKHVLWVCPISSTDSEHLASLINPV